jgi:DNA-binding transcriptional regulator YdaS (Cro superfamily)
MTPEEALDKAIEYVGSMQALGARLGVTKGAVGQWKLPDRQVPAEKCPDIEELTNGTVLCEWLRPDVNWAQVRGAPMDSNPPLAHQPSS